MCGVEQHLGLREVPLGVELCTGGQDVPLIGICSNLAIGLASYRRELEDVAEFFAGGLGDEECGVSGGRKVGMKAEGEECLTARCNIARLSVDASDLTQVLNNFRHPTGAFSQEGELGTVTGKLFIAHMS
jgi:hypothetical protein